MYLQVVDSQNKQASVFGYESTQHTVNNNS